MAGNLCYKGDALVDDNDLSQANRLKTQESSRAQDVQNLWQAALEKVYGTKDSGQRTVLIPKSNGSFKLVDLTKLSKEDKQLLFSKFYPDGRFEAGAAAKIRERFDRAGVSFGEVQVRWSNLVVRGRVAVGNQGMPTLWEASLNQTRELLSRVTGKGQVLRDMRIVDGVSGILKPARFTLLLGPPGSGKSMFLRALAGQLKRNSGVKVSYDELTYNGLKLDQFVVERTVAYISQADLHQGELTVRETLDFSSRCQGMEMHKNKLELLEQRERELGITPDEDTATWMRATSASGKSNLVTEVVLRMLGLHVCAETLVGSPFLKGVTSGQKKRVTTGEMLVGPTKVVLGDGISTGLDSTSAFDICQSLQQICHFMKYSMMISLLQPSPEVFDLFDDVLLLSSGRVAYHGPREGVLPFFEGLGFQCPERKGVADFLQEVTCFKEQKQYLCGSKGEFPPLLDDASISKAFYDTPAGKSILEELATPLDPATQQLELLSKDMYGRKQVYLFKANVRKLWTMMKRNMKFYISRIAQVIFMGFCTGTLFLNTKKESVSDAQMFMAVCFFSVVFISTGAFMDAIGMVLRLPVFYKQRDAHFYPTWAYVLPTVLLRLPWLFIEAWIWTIMVYFMVGFYVGARLLMFWAIIFVLSLFSSSLFAFAGAVARKQSVTMALLAFLLLVLITTSGFTLTSDKIPGGWKGAYWANPFAYFIRALLINELTSPDWAQPLPNGMTLGEAALIARGYQTEYKWVWAALFGWGIGSYFVNIALVMLACKYLSAPQPTNVVSDEALAERAGKLLASRKELADVTTPTDSEVSDQDLEEVERGKEGLEGEGSGGSLSGRKLPFKPLCLTFKDMKYSVPLPKGSPAEAASKGGDGPHSGQLLLLKGITGSFRPGVLTALMGACGAGKTTLMDVLAGRTVGGKVTGEILVNGFPREERAFARVAGYVEQSDIHLPEATVHEALMFSAQLRLPADTPEDTVVSFVKEVMSLVELKSIKDAPVGLPGEFGLSPEQRKRLTLAVELVANPSIVFMDEPTLGLDAHAATTVMRAVRNTVNTGRTVVCTIHQPSIEIFEAFDELLLLKRGGEVIFSGAINGDTVFSKLIDYFSAIPHVPAIKPRHNPAAWMMEVSSSDAESATGVDFAAAYQSSEMARANEAKVNALSQPPPGDAPLNFTDMQVAGYWTQLRLLSLRNLRQYNRRVVYNGTRLVITLVIGICFGTLYLYQGNNTNNLNGELNIAGALYVSVLFLGVLDCLLVQEIISIRRTVYYREHAARMYSSIPYSLAEVLVEVPYLIAQGVIYSLFVYWMVSFEADAGKFFWFVLIMILTLTYWTFFGIQNVHITPVLQLANVLTATLFSLLNLFCGFLKPQPQIPAGWIWMYYINPMSWTLYGLIVGQQGNMHNRTVTTPEGLIVTVPQFIQAFFGYERKMMGWIVLILFGYVFFFTFVAMVALRVFNFQKR